MIVDNGIREWIIWSSYVDQVGITVLTAPPPTPDTHAGQDGTQPTGTSVSAQSSSSAWKVLSAVFVLAPSHPSKRSQYLIAFDYALRNLLPSSGITIWRVEKLRKLLNGCFQYKQSQRWIAVPHPTSGFCFPSRCFSFTGTIKQQQRPQQDLPTQRNKQHTFSSARLSPHWALERWLVWHCDGRDVGLLKCKVRVTGRNEVGFSQSSFHIWHSGFSLCPMALFRVFPPPTKWLNILHMTMCHLLIIS